MSFVPIVMAVTLLGLYVAVSNNIDKYANSGNLVSRTIVLASGLAFGVLAAFVFLSSVQDPSWMFGIGFVLGPMFGVAALIYLVVGALFPLQQVQGLLRYSFRHKLGDDIRG